MAFKGMQPPITTMEGVQGHGDAIENMLRTAGAAGTGGYGDMENLIVARAKMKGGAPPQVAFSGRDAVLPTTAEMAPRFGADLDAPGAGVGEVIAPDFLLGPLGKALGLVATAAPIVARGATKGNKLAKVTIPKDMFKQRKSRGEMVYTGAPPGVKTEADIVRLAEDYADRVERALDDGIDQDWFYTEGENLLKKISKDPVQADKSARVNAITSSEAPVRTNFGWAGKAFEQAATGKKVHTGKYPNTMSPQIQDVIDGGRPGLGEKRQLYGEGLSGEGRAKPFEERKAPNDRWEIRSMGYDKDSATPGQHDFMHKVRALARDLVNERRGTDLDAYNAQELNWATYRADDMGVTIQESAADNLQDSLDYYLMNHTWETQPGVRAKHAQGLEGEGLAKYDEDVRGTLVDPETGRDKLIDAMSGNNAFQLPVERIPGLFEGNVTPYGNRSSSQIFHAGGQLDPSSQERVAATEAIRGLMTGQDANAANMIVQTKQKTMPGFGSGAMLKTEQPVTGDQVQGLVDTMSSKGYGSDDWGIIPTRTGANVISSGAKGVHKELPEIASIIGADPDQTVLGKFGNTGHYMDLPWEEGKATETVLETLTPAMREAADSPEVRDIAGNLAGIYRNLQANGVEPAARLPELLEAWKSGGMAAVEEMVKKGLAPAAVLGVFAAGMGGPSSVDQPGLQ